VIGLFSALAMNRRGHDVTVVDAGAADQGCSHGNSGLVVPSHFVPLASPGAVAKGLRWLADRSSPFRIKPSLDPKLARWLLLFLRSGTPVRVGQGARLLRDLALESLAAYQESARAGFGFRGSGLIMACTTARGLQEEREVADKATNLGLEVDELSASETCRALPGFEGTGGFFYACDAQLDPSLLMRWLKGTLKGLGVRFVERVRAVALTCRSGHAVAVGEGGRCMKADLIVVAAGSWSAQLVGTLGMRLPLVGGKGYSFVSPQPDPPFSRPAILVEDRVAVSPLGRSVRWGGTLEIGTRPGEIDMRRVEGITRAARRAFPGIDVPLPPEEAVWSGQRPCTPDGLPYIGRLRGTENVILATGHAMLGVTLAPATGRLVADCADGLPLPAALDPMRFV
jgi:D-amino-acid dehydrogenase